MPKITPESAMQLIEKERGIVRVLRSDPRDYSDLLFELKQFADPENVRPIRPLEPNADRTQVYDPKLNAFVPRVLKRKERGLPQPGNQRIKAVSGTLPPQDGKMRFYNHANTNKSHKHVIYGVDAGENPDRYLYLHKNNSTIEVKDEPCLIVACYAKDAGTNTKWHIKGQPLNDYHEGRYPTAISFAQLRKNNREFVKHRTAFNRHKDERNEIKFKPSVAALQFIGAVSESSEDLMNAQHFKILVWQLLKIDLPILIFSDKGKCIYHEKDQARDIVLSFAQGVSFAFDIHDHILSGNVPESSVFTAYRAMFKDYQEYVKHLRFLNGDEMLEKFFAFHKAKSIVSPHEEKTTTETNLKLTKDYQDAVAGRKLWGEIISQTYDYEMANTQDSSAVLARMKAAGFAGDLKKTYQDMCSYLQQHTRIVLAFDTQKVMPQTPVSLSYLNLSEMDALQLQQGRKSHLKERSAIENIAFSYLENIKERFEKTMQGRPRYAYFTFCNEANYPKPIKGEFGNSYFVLRDVMKFNSMFVPENVFQKHSAGKKPVRPCTYFSFDVLLDQSSDALLFGVAHAVTGQLPQYHIRNNQNFEMHAYIPSVELFNQDVVERLYVSPNEYKMSSEEVAFLEEHGIKVCNVGTHAYHQDELDIEAAVRADDVTSVQRLIKQNPFMQCTYASALEKSDVALYHYLLRHDPEAKPLSWQEMLERVHPDKIELFHPFWTEAQLKGLTAADLNKLSVYKDKVLASNSKAALLTLLKWLKQFNTANIPLRDFSVDEQEDKEAPDMLLGTYLGKRILQDCIDKNKYELNVITPLIESGLLSPEHIAKAAHSLFKNALFRKTTQFLIEKNYYQLTYSDSEKEALLSGENYEYIMDDPRMAAKIVWHHNLAYYIVQLLLTVKDKPFLEKSLLNMHAAGAFSGMGDSELNGLLREVAEKNPDLLFVFMAAVFCVPLQAGSDLLHVTLSALAIVPGGRTFKDFLFKNVVQSQVAIQEEKASIVDTMTVADWQAKFLHVLHNEPDKLRRAKTIDLFCEKLPSFDFLHAKDPVRYSIVCMNFYFPELVKAWITKPQLLSVSQLQELIVWCMRNDGKKHKYVDKVCAMFDLVPELIHTQVPGSGNSLLHIAFDVGINDVTFIHRLMHSKVAHLNNTKGHSTLQHLIEMNAKIRDRALKIPSELNNLVTELLVEISFSNEQLISALDEMRYSFNAYARQICAVLNINQVQGDAVKSRFLTAVSDSSSAQWKAYLQIKSIPQAAFQEAALRMIESKDSLRTKQDIHTLLDSATDFDYSVIADYLKQISQDKLSRLHFSYILSHPNCRLTDAETIRDLVSEFSHTAVSFQFPPQVLQGILENYLIGLDRANALTELRQHHYLLLNFIRSKAFSLVLLLLRFQFVLSEDQWTSILVKYAAIAFDPASQEMRTVLIAILHMQPHRISAAWDIFYKQKMSAPLLSNLAYGRNLLRNTRQVFCAGLQVDADLSAKMNADLVEVVDCVTRNTAKDLSYLRVEMKAYNLLSVIMHFMNYDQYIDWKQAHKSVAKECHYYEKKMSALSEEIIPVKASDTSIDVSTEAGLDKWIAVKDISGIPATLLEKARAELKQDLVQHDTDKGFNAHWEFREHLSELRRAVKTYYVLCLLDPRNDDEYTRIRISYYYFMTSALWHCKDETIPKSSNAYSFYTNNDVDKINVSPSQSQAEEKISSVPSFFNSRRRE